jgi:hypothetical protein
VGTLTEKSLPQYTSPPPVMMKKFQPLDSGTKTPIFDIPYGNSDAGSKLDESIQ